MTSAAKTSTSKKVAEPAHSPAPFHLSPYGRAIISADGKIVAKIPEWRPSTSPQMTEEERAANIHLFVAAPDLLSALIDMVQTNQGELTIEHYHRARAAISKAEGR